jgi:tetratricopeptide (TPR) repeat protein
MYNTQIARFKPLSLILLVAFLGACAAPSYGPVVEDLSVSARHSERLPSSSTNVYAKDSANGSTNAAVSSEASAIVDTAQPTLYVAPKTEVTITAQPILNQVITPSPSPSPSPEVAMPVVQGVQLPVSDQAVVEQLLAEADQLKAQGKVTQAVIQLQRAQRIAPREPKVYARLAALLLSLGEASRAEQLALKGLTLVPNKKSYQYYFWKLIGASRSHLGDGKGEASAIFEAEKYK